MASKKFPPGANLKLEKREERTGRDLDHDGEKGEPAVHKRKIRAAAMKRSAKGACPVCKKKGMSTCSHG